MRRSILDIARRGQAVAELRMTDTCRITRDGSAPTGDLDPTTGLPDATARATVYEGRCWVHTGGSVSAGSQRNAGADTVTQVASMLHLPIGAPVARVDDRVEILTSVNPSLLSVYTVSGVVPGSQMTAQRVSVTAVID